MNLYDSDTWLLIAIVGSPLGLVAACLLLKFKEYVESDRARRDRGG